MTEDLKNTEIVSRKRFSDQYKDEIFYLWYRAGKPVAHKLYQLVSSDINGNKPTMKTLEQWTKYHFRKRADKLDSELQKQYDKTVVRERIDMLNRHAGIGLEMQTAAMEYLEENKENLTVPSAVRLLIEGVRIERQSRGVPDAMSKIIDKSDDEILELFEEIITNAPSLNVIDAEFEDENE